LRKRQRLKYPNSSMKGNPTNTEQSAASLFIFKPSYSVGPVNRPVILPFEKIKSLEALGPQCRMRLAR
jgi:hypothetical protein